MKSVVIVNGKPRAGKDTFIAMVQKHLLAEGIATGSFSSIDPVRDMLTGIGIDTGAKTEADRLLLATVGDAVQVHNSWRLKWCCDHVLRFFSMKGDGVFFLHVREPKLINDLRLLLSQYDVVRVGIVSPRELKITSNAADEGAGSGIIDMVVSNDGNLADLELAAKQFIKWIARAA